MAQVVSRGFAALMVGAALAGLAGCGGGGAASGNSASATNVTTTTVAKNTVTAAAPAAPMGAAPAAPASGPTRYCGMIHNTSVGQDEQGEIDVNPGSGFSGVLILNGSNLTGGAGAFQGQIAGGQCSGAASDGLAFWGPCPSGGQYNGSYAINGQQGSFQMSTSACH